MINFVNNKIIEAVVSFVSGVNKDIFCRLCFNNLEKHKFQFLDEIVLESPYCRDAVSIKEMLFDLNIDTSSALPESFCLNCTILIKDCYIFQKACQLSAEKWSETIKFITNALPTDIKSDANSLYLIPKGTECKVLFDRSIPKESEVGMSKTKRAVNRIKSIVKRNGRLLKEGATEKNIICETCGQTISKNAMFKHLKIHNNDACYCNICEKKLKCKSLLNDHMRRAHLEKNVQCEKCPKMFFNITYLNEHIKMKHESVTCKVCSVKIPSRTVYKSHMAKHEPLVTCGMCKKKYRGERTLKKHFKFCVANPNNKRFECDICGITYINKHLITRHIEVVHGYGDAFICEWCNTRWSNKQALASHVLTHTKEKNFHCILCNGKFVTRHALLYHTRIHTGEKPYHCDQCDLSFLSASRLSVHKRWKHIGPTYECEICLKKFVTGTQRKRHMVRHYNPSSKLYVGKQ